MNLILAAFYKELIYKKRYLINTIFSMIMFCVIFALLMLGAVTIAGDNALMLPGVYGLAHHTMDIIRQNFVVSEILFPHCSQYIETPY